MSEDNITRQAEEIEALCAIYGDDWCVVNESNQDYSIQINDGEEKSTRNVIMEIHIPEDYPESSPPEYQLMAPWLSRDDKRNLEADLADIYCENLGEIIIYLWIEKIRELIQTKSQGNQVESQAENLSASNSHHCDDQDKELDEIDWSTFTFDHGNQQLETGCVNSDQLDIDEDLECPTISHGSIILDRKSVFQGHLAPIIHKKQVILVMDTLCENRKIANATHNIYAYRIHQNGTFYQGCEDDGETHAGARLLHLLQILDVTNVIVVVSRWYGGIHLGPDRFKHINNAARSILEEGGYIQNKESKKGPKSGGKKKK